MTRRLIHTIVAGSLMVLPAMAQAPGLPDVNTQLRASFPLGLCLHNRTKICMTRGYGEGGEWL